VLSSVIREEARAQGKLSGNFYLTVSLVLFYRHFYSQKDKLCVSLNQFPSNAFFARILIVSSNGTFLKRSVTS